jgi:BlaI family penicillinase repressor
MSGKKRLILTKLELLLMKIIWEKGRATVHEVQQSLPPENPLAYTTILTMLRILENKGFLKHDVQGRTYVYRPLAKQDEVSQGMLKDLLDRLFDGSKVALLNTLLEAERIPQEELQELRRLIDEKERVER